MLVSSSNWPCQKLDDDLITFTEHKYKQTNCNMLNKDTETCFIDVDGKRIRFKISTYI